MPKKVKELRALGVKRKAQQPGFHAVGGVAGLHLLTRANESGGFTASWILRATVGKRRRDFGLGGYPDVTLEQARQGARDFRDSISAGRDPLAEINAAKEEMLAVEARRLTFEDAAMQCHAARSQEFKSARHQTNWFRSLEIYAIPKLGDLPVSQIVAPQIVSVLEPIWAEKTDTAKRVRQRIETVLSWATVGGYREGLNPARWQGNLDQLLAKPSKISKVVHYRALPWQEVGEFMSGLRKREGMGARALEFAILTAARSGEVRYSTWDEIDLKAKLWTISADRMKVSKPHRVPLSQAATDLLEALPRASQYVFPNGKGGVLSDMSLSSVTRRMGVDAVPHGFRSTFKDWARVNTAYPDEVSELALAHVNDDATRAAYARDELLPKRAKMMQAWAEYLYVVYRKKNGVVSING